jgi:hypothetical protein
VAMGVGPLSPLQALKLYLCWAPRQLQVCFIALNPDRRKSVTHVSGVRNVSRNVLRGSKDAARRVLEQNSI